MTATIWQAFIKDDSGNILPGATITVRDLANNIVTIWSNRAGTTTKANPFVADEDGYAFFYRTAGAYKITAVSGAFTATFEHVPFGNAQEYDIGTAGATLVLAEDFATVALEGDYNDLTNKPTLGTMAARDTGTAGSQHRTNTQNDAQYFKIASNLSEGTASAMRSNLGLGTAAIASTDDLYQALSTGNVTGGALSINTDTAKFDIAETKFDVVDHSTSPPTLTSVTVAAQTAVVLTDLATAASTDLAYNASGELQQARSFSTAQKRSLVVLGGVDHSNNTSISRVFSLQIPAYAPALTAHDIARALGDVNLTGNDFSEASTNLTIKKSAGTAFSFGRNAVNSKTDPHTTTQIAQDPVTFTYVKGDGAGGATFTGGQTNIDPSQYDLNGVLTAVGSNNWSIQRLLMFNNSGSVFVQYGTQVFNKKSEALLGITAGAFVDLPGIRTASVRGYLVVINGATNLSLSAQREFRRADKFGSLAGNDSGDVTGPATSVDGNFALFDGVTGDALKDGGTPGTAAIANVTTGTTDATDDRVIRSQDGVMLGRANTLLELLTANKGARFAMSSGRVGINRATPNGLLHIQSAATEANELYLQAGDETSKVEIRFGDSVASNRASIVFENAANELTLKHNNVEKQRVTSTGVAVTGAISATTGVTVATSQDVLANNKQDTYTATLTCGTSGTITLNSSVSDTLSYTRIGKICHVTGYLSASAVSSPLGSLTLNLPFVSANTAKRSAWGAGVIQIFSAVTRSANEFTLLFANNSSTIGILTNHTNSTPGDAAPEITTDSDIYLSFSYPVA